MLVQSTSNEFKVRFRNHKSAMSTKKTTCEVAVYFNKEKHQLSDFEFIVIKQICNSTINTTLTNVFLQERHFGVPNYALFNLVALTKDRNLIPRIELSIIDTSHPLICIFYYF